MMLTGISVLYQRANTGPEAPYGLWIDRRQLTSYLVTKEHSS